MHINPKAISLNFVLASGPGGQNVNKVATAVQLRVNLSISGLPFAVLNRLRKIAGRRINNEDILLINASRYRTQARNRQDALERLQELVDRAGITPKVRRKTRPSKGARQRRMDNKTKRGTTKRLRGNVPKE